MKRPNVIHQVDLNGGLHRLVRTDTGQCGEAVPLEVQAYFSTNGFQFKATMKSPGYIYYRKCGITRKRK